LARRERDGRVSARLLALANALDGLPREEAARLAGMTGQTLRDWVHRYGDLIVPGNLTLAHLPPYSSELNPVERVWLYLRERWLSHRVLTGGYEAVLDAACAAWNALLEEPGRLRSLTSYP
jgi:transposase